jgi:23S rRNA (guanosine2251-2'-O)-methyltransferase
MNSIIAGRKPVMEALKAGTEIEQIVFLVGVQGRVIDEIKALAERRQVQIVHANKQQFRELATNATTQGVVAVVPTKRFVDLVEIVQIAAARNEPGLLLVLDEIEDPHNLGALVRTAECAGAHGVVVPRHGSAPVTSTAVKASAGATEHMAMAEVTNITNALEELKTKGYWVIGLDANGDKDYTAVDYTSPIAIVVGNEGKGIRRLVREHCDHLARIPLYGKIESLNASVAGALVLYEAAKQRHQQREGEKTVGEG